MKRVFRVFRKGKVKPIALSTLSGPEDLDAKVALIQALIPLGLLAVAEALKHEVLTLLEKDTSAKEAFRESFAGASKEARSTWATKGSRSPIAGCGIGRTIGKFPSRPISACRATPSGGWEFAPQDPAGS